MSTTWVITGRSAKFGGQCKVCGKWVDPARHWEAILLQVQGGREYGVAHAGCLGGDIGGVQRKWRGPDTITVED